ncbi:LysE/ArgO family amino acid transporter [Aggregatilinea lenta]|uniref:LysE/ArgO family amino acid transporter n=1 Tax=Aggregatilinea lenta TaxID=913108 RepID=UPI000E5B63E4|nr:LysE family translocator [Aggregatilinea lenta]
MLFLRGLIIGFSIAAPVGPIGVLCIRRTLADGRAHGLVSGLGAATADAMYGAIAAFGLTAVSGFLVDQQTALRLIGGAFLIFLGVRTLRARPAENAAVVATPNGSLRAAYLSTVALTLTNPATILSFVAIFAGLGLSETGGDALAALGLVAGVFAGSAAWWLLLSGGVSLLRTSFTPRRLRWVNWASGAILAGFGLLAMLSALS